MDPRLLAAVQGSTTPQDDKESVYEDSSDEDEKPKTETRAEKLERLTREYEEEVARSKAAADVGEGCLHCSA